MNALSAIQFALLLALAAVSVCATQCPRLNEAVRSFSDFNNSRLNFRWFVDRGFKTSAQYGCRKPVYSPDAAPLFNFALGCDCPNWAQCTGDPLEYEWLDGRTYVSLVGECGCCSGWVIFLIVLASLLVLALMTRGKWLIVHIVRWYRRRHKLDDSRLTKEPSGDSAQAEFTDVEMAKIPSSASGTVASKRSRAYAATEQPHHRDFVPPPGSASTTPPVSSLTGRVNTPPIPPTMAKLLAERQTAAQVNTSEKARAAEPPLPPPVHLADSGHRESGTFALEIQHPTSAAFPQP